MAPTVKSLAEIIAVWRDAEAELTRLVADAARREALGTARHYRGQQDTLRALLAEVEDLMGRAVNATSAPTRELILGEYTTAVQNAVVAGGGDIPQGIPTEAMGAIVAETMGAVGSVRSNVLRDTRDAYRSIMGTVSGRQLATGMTKEAALQQALNLFADRGITGFVDKSGRRWGIDTYTDMAIRTATNRAGNTGRMVGYREAGVELIRVSSHKGCAPQCLPFQGKLLALDGQAGKRVVETAWGDTETVTVVATMDEALRAGYHHPNCRHVDTPYSPGAPAPKVDESTEADYEAEQRQRGIERHIRHWKKREAVAVTPGAKAQAKAKVRAWQAAQRDHLKAHPWLSRRYNREQMKAGVIGVTNPALRYTPPRAARLVAPKPLNLPEGFKYAPTSLAGQIRADKAAMVKAAAAKLTKGENWTSVTKGQPWAVVTAANSTDKALVNAAHRVLRLEDKVEHAKAMKSGKAFSPFATVDAVEDYRKALLKESRAERNRLIKRLQVAADPSSSMFIAPKATGPQLGKVYAAEYDKAMAKLSSLKKPFSAANGDHLAHLYVSHHKYLEQTGGAQAAAAGVAPAALETAEHLLHAKRHLKLMELLGDDDITAVAKANLSAAKKSMAAVAKSEPDGVLLQALIKAGNEDKTVLELAKKHNLIAEQFDAVSATVKGPKVVGGQTPTKGTPGPLGTTTDGVEIPGAVTATEMEYMVALKLNKSFAMYDTVLAKWVKDTGLEKSHINDLVNNYVSHTFKDLGDTAYLMTTTGKGKAAELAATILPKASNWAQSHLPEPAKYTPKATPKAKAKGSGDKSTFKYAPAPAPDYPTAPKPPPGGYGGVPKQYETSEALHYAAALRAAGYHKDLHDLVNEFALDNNQRPAQVHLWVGEIEGTKYKWAGPAAERPKSMVEARLALQNMGRKKYVGGALKDHEASDFKEATPEVLDYQDVAAAREYAERLWETYRGSTPKKYAAPLRTYTGNDYYPINSAERTTKGQKPHNAPLRDQLDEAFNTAPRNPDTLILRRGTTDDQFLHGNALDGVVSANPESWVGKSFIDWGYMSTSIGGRAAFSGKPVIMTIKVPPGNKMAYVSNGTGQDSDAISQFPGENEIVLQRQTKFKVLAVKVEGGKVYVDAEVIGQNA